MSFPCFDVKRDADRVWDRFSYLLWIPDYTQARMIMIAWDGPNGSMRVAADDPYKEN